MFEHYCRPNMKEVLSLKQGNLMTRILELEYQFEAHLHMQTWDFIGNESV